MAGSWTWVCRILLWTPVALSTPEMIRWHTRMRRDADGRAPQRSERGRCSCESNIQEYVGSQAWATAPNCHFWHLQSDGDKQRQLVGWVILLRKGRRRLCWVKTGSLAPWYARYPWDLVPLHHYAIAHAHSSLEFSLALSYLIFSKRIYKMKMVCRWYGLEAWSPFIKSRALSGPQGFVPVTQKALGTFLGTVGQQKEWRQHPWPWIHCNFIGWQRWHNWRSEPERTKTKLSQHLVQRACVWDSETTHKWGRRVRHNVGTKEQQLHPKATLP